MTLVICRKGKRLAKGTEVYSAKSLPSFQTLSNTGLYIYFLN